MDAPEGRILSIDANAEPMQAVVEVTAALGCPRCAAGKGCGAGLLLGDNAPRRVEAVVAGNLDLKAGDRVRLELTANNVLRAAAFVYGLPLVGALGAAALAWWWGAGDASAALAALAGAVAGALAGFLRLRRADCLRQFTPTVISRIGAG